MKFVKLILTMVLLFSVTSCTKFDSSILHTVGQVSEELNHQILCMAKNIYYEAGSESYEGKLAVAQVTINRANHKDYPSDFCGVVYQKTGSTCQFSWTCEKVSVHKDEYAWEESMNIAKRTIHEVVLHKELAKKNALYYHANYVRPGWKKLKTVKTIGRHIFYARTEYANKE